MRPAPSQREPGRRRADPDGWPVPDVLPGSPPYVLNAEPDPSGGLLCACAADLRSMTTGRPLFADVSAGRTFIYLSENSTRLTRFELPAEGLVSLPRTEFVADIGQDIMEMARCGDFLVARLQDGSLYYLRADADTGALSAMGAVPAPPRVSVRAVAAATLTLQTASVDFGTVHADFRPGVPAEVSARLAAAAEEARKELLARARGAGLWTGAVCVRVAVRMADGTLLSVSEPVVAGSEYKGVADMPLFMLRETSAGFTGTGPAQLTCPAYRLEVTAEGAAPGAWADFAGAVEIWVTPQSESATGYSQSVASLFTSGGASGLRLSPPFTARPDIAALPFAQQELLAAVSPEAAARGHVCTRGKGMRTADPRLESAGVASLRCGALTAHDSFLHLADLTRPLPAPPLPYAPSGATRCGCIVTVNVRSDSGMLSARTVGSIAGPTPGPLLWYPDARAVAMRVAVLDADGGVREGVYPLTPAPDGSDCAFYAAPGDTLDGLAAVDMADSALLGPAETREPESVMTMRRGNPFVEASATAAGCGRVMALRAQPTGGGAYTRQYLYAFGERGVAAVMHDSRGVHVNARSVSISVAAGADAVCRSSRGVWMLSRVGEVSLLSDARVTTAVRGLTEYSRLAWCATSGALWLMPAAGGGGKSLLLEEGGGCSLRSVVPGAVISDDGSFLTTLPQGLTWRLYSVSRPSSSRLGAVWRSPELLPGFGGPALLTVETTADADTTLDISVRGLEPWLAPATMSWSDPVLAQCVAAPASPRRIDIPLLLPSLTRSRGWETHLEVTLSGRWASVASASFSPLARAPGRKRGGTTN